MSQKSTASAVPTDHSSRISTEETAKTDPRPHHAAHSTAPDPFNIDSLRLEGDYTSEIGVKRVLNTVPVRKPDKSSFIRVRPGEEHRAKLWTIEVQEEKDTTLYLVAPKLFSELGDESTLKARVLVTAIDRNGVVSIWPLKVPQDRSNAWSESAFSAAKLAETSWVRVQSNMRLGAYECYKATGNLPEPEWPEETFQDLIRIAFKDRLIDSIDHDVLRKYRGEI